MGQMEKPDSTDPQCCRRGFAASLKDTATRILADPSIAPRKVAKDRLAICESNQCGVFDSKASICGHCGCFMPLKTTMANMRCPRDYWSEWKRNPQQETESSNDN